VAPGFVPTDMARNATTGKMERSNEAIAARAMVGRVGTPEDIAHAVSFLISDGAGFITAQTLTVDGGRTDYLSHP